MLTSFTALLTVMNNNNCFEALQHLLNEAIHPLLPNFPSSKMLPTVYLHVLHSKSISMRLKSCLCSFDSETARGKDDQIQCSCELYPHKEKVSHFSDVMKGFENT